MRGRPKLANIWQYGEYLGYFACIANHRDPFYDEHENCHSQYDFRAFFKGDWGRKVWVAGTEVTEHGQERKINLQVRRKNTNFQMVMKTIKEMCGVLVECLNGQIVGWLERMVGGLESWLYGRGWQMAIFKGFMFGWFNGQ